MIKKSAWLLATVLLATSAYAQTTPESNASNEDAAEEIRRYTVEMIVFTYSNSVSAGSEIFVPDEPVFDLLNESDESSEVPADRIVHSAPQTDIGDSDNPLRHEWTMLAEDDFQLANIADRLDRLDAYNPVLHFGWTQATLPDDVTDARPLSSYVRLPAGLDGNLKLYLSRYLHLAIDLTLDAPDSETSRVSRPTPRSNDRYIDYAQRNEPQPVRYKINEDRIFRSGELRYFDHPKFGVLAKVTRVEDEIDEEFVEPGENQELLGD